MTQTLYIEIAENQEYTDVWALQKFLQQEAIQAKREGKDFRPNYFLFCEHSPVYTLGKSGKMSHLLKEDFTGSDGKVVFFKTNRGGDITYHGPGQITGYLIFDLDHFYHDLHRFVRDIEEAIILTLDKLCIKGQRIEGLTGVWIIDDQSFKRKICAIGVHMSRWVSMHGFALNVNTDLSYYNGIIPCGIQDEDKTVTSINRELGGNVELQLVRSLLRDSFGEVFGLEYF